MQPVLTVAQSRAFDQYLIEELGIPSLVLMENAAHGALAAIEDWIKEKRFPEVVIICGMGNNGGDGLALARLLFMRGIYTTVFIAGDPELLSGDAQFQYKLLQTLIENSDEEYECGIELLHTCFEILDYQDPNNIIIDALLGTGSTGAARGLILEGTQAINMLRVIDSHVLALDVPTGMDSDLGSNGGREGRVHADRTVAVGAPKIGFYLRDSKSNTGEVVIAPLGVPYPKNIFGNEPATYLLSLSDIEPHITPFPFNASKYTRGRILAICGSRGMTGAAIMAARSALKSGAGWVTVAIPHSERAIVAQAMPELLTVGIAEQSDGSPTLDAWNDLQRELEAADVVLIGCGYQPFDETAAFVRKIVTEVQKPMVIDGGALRSIAGHLHLLDSRKAPTILTPNTGELSALADLPREAVEQGVLDMARSIAMKHHVIVIAKNAPEYTVDADGAAYINPTGGPGMGTAGSGDVLAGITSTMLAHHPDSPASAAYTATYLCGLAGDLAAKEMTTHGMSATDIIQKLPEAFRALDTE